MDEDYTLTDSAGHPIVVGSRVRYFETSPCDPCWTAEVIDLGEWEGDVDAEGRSISLAPQVTVRREDGTLERWATSGWGFETRSDGDGEPVVWAVGAEVEELVVVEDATEGRSERTMR